MNRIPRALGALIAALLVFGALPSLPLAPRQVAAQDGCGRYDGGCDGFFELAVELIEEMIERAEEDGPAAAQSFYNGLSNRMKAEVDDVLNNPEYTTTTSAVTYEAPKGSTGDFQAAAAGCPTFTGKKVVKYALGRIVGGSMTQQIQWCHNSSNTRITWVWCYATYSHGSFWSFNGYQEKCTRVGGGVNYGSVAYKTQGTFSSIVGTTANTCLHMLGDAAGNKRAFNC
jgi:hypothetical protein